MKYVFICFNFLFLLSSFSSYAGKLGLNEYVSHGILNLADKNIVDPDLLPYREGGISMDEVIKEAQIMDEKDRKNIHSLILRMNEVGGPTLPEIREKLLPLFPALQELDLSYSAISKKDLEDIFEILKKYPIIKHMMLGGNSVAKAIENFIMQAGSEQNDLKNKIFEKIILYDEAFIDIPKLFLNQFPKWKDAHQRYYEVHKNSY